MSGVRDAYSDARLLRETFEGVVLVRGDLMDRIVVERRVGDDGFLQLMLALGLEEAGRDVRVTIERVDPENKMTPDAWRAGILATAGGWQGEFEPTPEGALEERDPLS